MASLDKKYTNFYLIVIALFLSLFAGLRSIDSDYIAYADIYRDIPYLSNFSFATTSDIHGEIGFLLFGSVFKSLGLGFELFIFFCALVSVSLVVFSVKRLSCSPIISLIFYFSHVFILREMMQIRAALAIAIILFSFSLSITSWKRIFLMAIAATFHSGAIVVIPFYIFLKKTTFNWNQYCVLFIVALTISNVGIAKPIIKMLSSYGLLPQAISTYVEWDLYNYHLATFTNPVVWKAFFILYFLRKNDADKLGDVISVIRNIYAAGLIFMLVFSDFAIIAGRVSTFLFFGEIILIAWVIREKRKNFYFVSAIFLISFMQLVLNLYINEVHTDYQLILFKG